MRKLKAGELEWLPHCSSLALFLVPLVVALSPDEARGKLQKPFIDSLVPKEKAQRKEKALHSVSDEMFWCVV